MCAQTRSRFIPSSIRFLGGMESEPMLTPRKSTLHRKNSPQRRIEPTTLHKRGQRAQHTTNELFPHHLLPPWGIAPLSTTLVISVNELEEERGFDRHITRQNANHGGGGTLDWRRSQTAPVVHPMERRALNFTARGALQR